MIGRVEGKAQKIKKSQKVSKAPALCLRCPCWAPEGKGGVWGDPSRTGWGEQRRENPGNFRAQLWNRTGDGDAVAWLMHQGSVWCFAVEFSCQNK